MSELRKRTLRLFSCVKECWSELTVNLTTPSLLPVWITTNCNQRNCPTQGINRRWTQVQVPSEYLIMSGSETTRHWKCMCGAFSALVTGDANLACWCHCASCRAQTGAAMQLGVWPADKFAIVTSGDLIKFSKTEGVTRISCAKCGSFCYKVVPDGAIVAPLGSLEPLVKPTCHIFVADKGQQPVMFPELPQHDGFPA